MYKPSKSSIDCGFLAGHNRENTKRHVNLSHCALPKEGGGFHLCGAQSQLPSSLAAMYIQSVSVCVYIIQTRNLRILFATTWDSFYFRNVEWLISFLNENRHGRFIVLQLMQSKQLGKNILYIKTWLVKCCTNIPRNRFFTISYTGRWYISIRCSSSSMFSSTWKKGATRFWRYAPRVFMLGEELMYFPNSTDNNYIRGRERYRRPKHHIGMQLSCD